MIVGIILGTFLNLVFLLIMIIVNRKEISRVFIHVKKMTWIVLILIVIFSFYLRTSVAPHYVFFDEFYRLDAAKNLLLFGDADVCNYVTYEVEKCWPYQKPLGSVLIFSRQFAHIVFKDFL